MPWKTNNFAAVGDAFERIAHKACLDAAGVVLAAAQNEVPHDEGTLMRSGGVLEAPEEARPGAIVHFGGGPGTGHERVPYAIRHHEVPANFQKGRKNNYLRDPFNAYAADALTRALKKRIDEWSQPF